MKDKKPRSLWDGFREIYTIMADNLPSIMKEGGKPFCSECEYNFIKRMKELAQDKKEVRDGEIQI